MTHSENFSSSRHIHTADVVVREGASMADAKRVMFLIHGRGGTAEDILTLAHFFQEHEGEEKTAFIAPQATDNTWYPYSFMAPVDANEPGLSSGLAVIQTLSQAATERGIAPEKQYFLGFSQGACLMLEFAARNATRFGGIYAFSGGVIGPEGTPRNYTGNFSETPVFMGCSDIDPHIPKARFLETAELYKQMGAEIQAILYPNMPHTIIQDEITRAVELFTAKSHSK